MPQYSVPLIIQLNSIVSNLRTAWFIITILITEQDLKYHTDQGGVYMFYQNSRGWPPFIRQPIVNSDFSVDIGGMYWVIQYAMHGTWHLSNTNNCF